MSVSGNPSPVSSVQLHYRVDGDDWNTIAANLAGGIFTAIIPQQPCLKKVNFYFSASTQNNFEGCLPVGGPNSFYSAISAESVAQWDSSEMSDFFVVDQDVWGGAWEYGSLINENNGVAPDRPYSDNWGTWVTGLNLGANLVGGPTELISPAYDWKDFDLVVMSFARWFSADIPGNDSFSVSISENDGLSWNVIDESKLPISTWVLKQYEFRENLSSKTRLKFAAQNNSYDSVHESAIDDFKVEGYSCRLPSDGMNR